MKTEHKFRGALPPRIEENYRTSMYFSSEATSLGDSKYILYAQPGKTKEADIRFATKYCEDQFGANHIEVLWIDDIVVRNTVAFGITN